MISTEEGQETDDLSMQRVTSLRVQLLFHVHNTSHTQECLYGSLGTIPPSTISLNIGNILCEPKKIAYRQDCSCRPSRCSLRSRFLGRLNFDLVINLNLNVLLFLDDRCGGCNRIYYSLSFQPATEC